MLIKAKQTLKNTKKKRGGGNQEQIQKLNIN